jgi:hypothetical protein
MQIMDEEVRRGESNVADGADAKLRIKWIELAEHGQVEAAVVEYVRFKDVVTFAQLTDDFAAYLETKGEYGLVLRADPKVVVWTRMSRELADVVSNYVESKRMYLHPTTPENYQGIWHPALPPVSEVGDERVDKPHWLPALLRLLPPQQGSRKYGRLARIKLGKS